MSKQRAKGTAWETELLGELRTVWPDAERAALKGINDNGDFINVEGLQIEAKKTDVPHFLQWAKTAQAKVGRWRVVWSGDRRRKDGPFVMMSLQDWLELEKRAR
jgi:hypothetical protein